MDRQTLIRPHDDLPIYSRRSLDKWPSLVPQSGFDVLPCWLARKINIALIHPPSGTVIAHSIRPLPGNLIMPTVVGGAAVL